MPESDLSGSESDVDGDGEQHDDSQSEVSAADDDEEEDASSLSELSSDEDVPSTPAPLPPTPVNGGRRRPRKNPPTARKTAGTEAADHSLLSAASSRRSLRRHGLPPDEPEAGPLKAPKKSSIGEEHRTTRSGARRIVSAPAAPAALSRIRSGRKPLPAPRKPIRQKSSSSAHIEVEIGPSTIDKAEFSPGGDPKEYTTPSPTKRRRRLSTSEHSVAGEQGEDNKRRKRRKVKNRGWSRSGTAKVSKSDPNQPSPSAPRASRKRLFRPDPALRYLTEVFRLNDNGGEGFAYNGDALSVPFPFTFSRTQGISASTQPSKNAATDEAERSQAVGADESTDTIEMPFEGPLSVVETSSKEPLKIPANWIPPLPPQAVRHLARVERRRQRERAPQAKKEAEAAAAAAAQLPAEPSAEVKEEQSQDAEPANGKKDGDVEMFGAAGEPRPAEPVALPTDKTTPVEDVKVAQSLHPNPNAEDPTKALPGPSTTSALAPPEPEAIDQADQSDSDSESDDGISPLRPSSFYPTPGGSGGFPGIPIFTPTMSQFADFYSLCKRIDAWGMRTGIVKIIPPKEWTGALPDLNVEVEAEPESAENPVAEKVETEAKQAEAAASGEAAKAVGSKPEAVQEMKAKAGAEAAVGTEQPEPEPSEAQSSTQVTAAAPAAPAETVPATGPPAAPIPLLRTIRIRNAIRQVVLAVGSGAYSQTNLTTPNKVWNAKQWADICASEPQRGPELERMKRKIESLKVGADAMNVHGLSGYRRKRMDAAAAEDLEEMMKETEGVRTRSGRKHRTARDEEADDEEDEEEGADAETARREEGKGKQRSRADGGELSIHSPPRSEHGGSPVKAAARASSAEAAHVLTPPASHANDGSDRSDHQAGSPPATGAPSTHAEPAGGEVGMEVDPDMPALEEVTTGPGANSEAHDASPTKEGPAAPKKVSMPDRTTLAEWRTFDYKTCWLKEALDLDENQAREDDAAHGASTSAAAEGSSHKTLPSSTEWTIDVCNEIEGEYWRNLTRGKPAMYGADLPGTLFKPDMNIWNVGKLDSLLTRMRFRRKLRGVTTPYLYFGMWRATFAWHLEDMDLYSINYIHFGAPKQWYAIPQTERKRFETAMASAFPGDARKCPHFMRHKSYLVSPRYLARHNIKPLKLVQHAGEFVITYPYGYHSGFNLGFNCAESVNFALDTWVEIGRNAGFCKCRSDSVQMDVEAILEEALEEDAARAKKEVEDAEKKERVRLKKLLASSSSAGGAGKGKAKLGAGAGAVDENGVPIRKAKRPKKEKDLAAAAAAAAAATPDADADQEMLAAGTEKKPVKPKGFPCVFCPSMIEDEMIRVPAAPGAEVQSSPKIEEGESQEAGSESAAAGAAAATNVGGDTAEAETKTPTKVKPPSPVRYAHRLCANILPETWVHREVEVVTVRKPISPVSAPRAKPDIVPSSDDEGDHDDASMLVDRVASGSELRYEEVQEEIVKDEEVRGFENIERARWTLKCSLCPTTQLAKQGCKVQCTRSKCSRAAHVTCANLADSGWYVAIVPTAEADRLEFGGMRSKKGVKVAKGKGKAVAAAAAASSATATPDLAAAAGEVAGADSSAADLMDVDGEDGPIAGSSAEVAAVEDEGADDAAEPGSDERLVLLCRAHNPEAKKAEATRKALALREQCLALRPMSLINVRAGSNSGVWQVLLLEIHDVPGGEAAVRAGAAPTTKGEAVVMYDGQRHRMKWGRIELGAEGKAAMSAAAAVAGSGGGGGTSGSATPALSAGASGSAGPSSVAGVSGRAESAPVSATNAHVGGAVRADPPHGGWPDARGNVGHGPAAAASHERSHASSTYSHAAAAARPAAPYQAYPEHGGNARLPSTQAVYGHYPGGYNPAPAAAAAQHHHQAGGQPHSFRTALPRQSLPAHAPVPHPQHRPSGGWTPAPPHHEYPHAHHYYGVAESAPPLPPVMHGHGGSHSYERERDPYPREYASTHRPSS